MAGQLKNLTALASTRPATPASHQEAVSLLEALEENPAPEKVRAALDHFREAAGRMDEVTRELARESAVKKLKALNYATPARIVDAAMPLSREEESPGSLGLEEPSLWPERVEGAPLLDTIEATAARFLAVSSDQLAALTLWVLFAHTHDAFEISPILAFTSPDKGCGKSTALALLGALVPKPLTSANITPSAVFRVTDHFKPCLLLDEADTFLSDSEGLRGILNSGHMRSQAYVTRVTGDDFRVCKFSTWAPKAVALIGNLPPTLADRSLTIRMRRRALGETIERLQLHRLGEMEDLRSMAARWASDHVEELRISEPLIPECITRDRARDNWRPLLAIADLAGQDWPRRARECAARMAASSSDETSHGITLLADLRNLFHVRGGERMTSEEILAHLHRMEERPWPEWRDRGPMSARQLAVLLQPFGVSPVKWKGGKITHRGYLKASFLDIFSRYLPPEAFQAPPPSLQSTYGPLSSATGTVENSPVRACNPSIFTAVADEAAGKIREEDSPSQAPPRSYQSTYGPPLADMGSPAVADRSACNSNEFKAVADEGLKKGNIPEGEVPP